MTGRVTMLNISRWTPKGGSYRTIQRFFSTDLPWGTLFWIFFRSHLLDPESEYFLAADETVKPKSGKNTYGLFRFFSALYGKTIPSLSFLGVSLVSVKKRDAYPMFIEQIVRDDTSSEPTPSAPIQQVCDNTELIRPRGRPKGSKNRNKDEVVLTGILKQLQTIVLSIRQEIKDLIPLRYLVLDGYFGHNNAQQMTKQCGLHLISKLCTDAALYWQPTTSPKGPGRPRVYGEKFNPREIEPKYPISTETTHDIRTEVYQMNLRHRKFTELLNIVCVRKTNLLTNQQSYILLFSSDLA